MTGLVDRGFELTALATLKTTSPGKGGGAPKNTHRPRRVARRGSTTTQESRFIHKFWAHFGPVRISTGNSVRKILKFSFWTGNADLNFRSGFDALPVSAQAEILKNRVRRIVVREDGVYAEIYGRAPERILRLLDGGLKKEHPTQTPEGSRTGVRTVSKLVEVTGIEPATSNMPCSRSPS